MLGSFALYIRLFVFVLMCTAVMLFIMCLDAARASPIVTKEHNGVKHNVPRRLYATRKQHQPPSIGLLSTETGKNRETGTSENDREALSIIDHQSNSLRFTQGSFDYHQNNPDNSQSEARITKVQRGHRTGGVMPASSIFTRHVHHGGFDTRQSTEDDYTFSQRVAKGANSYNSYSAIIRQPSPSSAFSQYLDDKYTQKSHNGAKEARSDSPKMGEDTFVGKFFDSSLFPSQIGGYRSALPPRVHYSGYKKTNELLAVGPQSTSSGIQSSKFLSFASRTAPHATSIIRSTDASVIKGNPRLGKMTPSIAGSSQGLDSVSSSETLRHKQVESYLLKDSHNSGTGDGQEVSSGLSNAITMPHKLRPSGSHIYSRFSSNFKEPHRKDLTKQDNVNLLYPNIDVAQYGGQTRRFTNYQPVSSIYTPLHIRAQSPTQVFTHPASLKGPFMQSFVSTLNAHSWDATSSEKSVPGGMNATARESMYKPGWSTKSIYGFRRFENPLGHSVKGKITSQQYNFDKGQSYGFKIANKFPSLSPKYSFGQRGATTTTPVKPKQIPTDYSSPSPGVLDGVQMTTVPTTTPFTSGFQDIQHLLPQSDASVDRNPNHRQFTIYKRKYGLKGFGSRPLEGAKTLVGEIDESATLHQGFESFKLQRSQTWKPKIIRGYNRTGKPETGTKNVSTVRQNEQSSKDVKTLLKTAGSTEPVTRFTPDRKTHIFLGLQSVKNRTEQAHSKTHWKYTEQNLPFISSAHLRSVGGLKLAPSPTSEPRTLKKTKLVAMNAILHNSSTSSTVRGRLVRVKHKNSKELNQSNFTNNTGHVVIVRLPKRPAGVKAITYADILGSASFSGVRATNQTPTTPPDDGHFPNMTATTRQQVTVSHRTLNSPDGVRSGKNTSKNLEAEDEKEDFSSVGQKDNNTMKSADVLRDKEGSGGFNVSDVGSLGLGEDLSELDYLRTSTGNISFKSMKLSRPDKQ